MTALKKVVRLVPKSAPDRPKVFSIMDAALPSKNGQVTDRYVIVDRDKIEANPFQPRKRFEPESIKELSESMFSLGQIQAITVRPHPRRAGHYQLISGERRWRASEPRAGFNGLPLLKALVREADDAEMGNLAFTENIQREELTPSEEVAFVEKLTKDGLSQIEIEERFKKSRNWAHKRVKGSRIGDDLKWLLDLPGTLDLAIEADKVKNERLRYRVANFLKGRVDTGAGCSLRELKLFADSLKIPKARPRKTQPSAWTTHNDVSETTAPVPARPDPSEAANGNAAANGTTIVTRSYETPARPAQTVQTSIEYSNSPIIESQNVPRYPRENVMQPEGVAALLDRCEAALPVFINEYGRLQQSGAWAHERRIEMRQKLMNIIHFAESAIKAVDAVE